ncbi:MAG: heme exporter protein CcmD [Pseudomonadota bacterium]
MIWQSWNDFFAMGGYALYVWGSVLFVFGLIGIELFELLSRRKNLLSDIAIENKVRSLSGKAEG